MFVNALLDRILKSVRRYFRQEYSRRPYYRRRREHRRSFLRSLVASDAPSGTIAPRRHPLLECLESRVYLTGNPVANNDTFVVPFNGQITPAAPGVLAVDSDPNQGATMYTVLVTGPADANYFHFNSDGSFAYKPNFGFFGTDSFTYYIHDSFGYTSNTATVSLPIEYSVNSSADLTKAVAIDPLDTSVQILGSASGAPATPQNLSLAYDSVAGQPDAVIEATFQLSSITPIPDTPSATLTFNGVQQPATYVNLQGMGDQANVDISYQIDTSGLSTGRYPYSMTLNSPKMTAPATISGAVNVINDSAGPVGKGWDIPGLYHLYQNNVSGEPAGVLLTTGVGTGWYFTSSGGNSFTSPNGPFAFDTLTSVTGGGWKLLDKFGISTAAALKPAESIGTPRVTRTTGRAATWCRSSIASVEALSSATPEDNCHPSATLRVTCGP